MKTIFLRALESEDKAAALLAAIQDPQAALGKQRFEVDPATFGRVPQSSFAYWLGQSVLDAFAVYPSLEQGDRYARRGAYTTDDFRVNRLRWEVAPYTIGGDRSSFLRTSSNAALAKGGVFASYYADIHLVIRWTGDGREAKSFVSNYRARKGWGDDWSACLNGYALYFRPGLTYSIRSQRGLSFRAMPTGCIFSLIGPAIFVDGDSSPRLLSLLAVLNSRAFGICASAQMAFGMYQVGVIQRTPLPNLNSTDEAALSALALRAWSIKRSVDTGTETSQAFVLPALLQVEGDSLEARTAIWARRVRGVGAELASIQGEIDARCFDLYGIDQIDRCAVDERIGSIGDNVAAEGGDSDTESDAESEADESDAATADAASLAADLVSWATGVSFGRFDVRLATDDRSLEAKPQPFDPLPVCSPGMLTGDDGLPFANVPAGYRHAFPENGILVDDPGHPRDLTVAVRTVFDTVFGTRADAWWNEVAAALDPRDHDPRAWIRSSFFEHHLRRYSKSRRKAPILWQLATPSGRYGVWLYVHRLTRDSFFQLQNDVIAPKVAHEERQLIGLVQGAGGSPSAKQRKEIAAQAAFVEELRALLDEVKRVTPLWNPMLDDGVVLTMAPLWRLVPHHKPWQKELKGKWDELAAGKYDWAHLTMHLWPERVVPKCATDRSLAIAHGLEDVFWVEDAVGKWKPRPTPTHPVAEIVRERTSAAVKAALKSLLEAPLASTGGARRGARRVASVAAD